MLIFDRFSLKSHLSLHWMITMDLPQICLKSIKKPFGKALNFPKKVWKRFLKVRNLVLKFEIHLKFFEFFWNLSIFFEIFVIFFVFFLFFSKKVIFCPFLVILEWFLCFCPVFSLHGVGCKVAFEGRFSIFLCSAKQFGRAVFSAQIIAIFYYFFLRFSR